MNWRRGVRFGAAAIGLACAVALFLLYRPRDTAPPAPIPELPLADPKAVETGSAGRMIYDGARGDLVVEYKARNVFEDGRTRFEGTHAVSDDGRFELWADRIETKGAATPGVMPSTFDISGNVRFSGGAGLTLETQAAVYDDKTGVVTMSGPVTFTRGRLSGTSVGAEYLRDEARIRLIDQAVARIAAGDDGRGAIEMTGASMVMLRELHSVHLEKSAQITSDRQRLTGDTAVIVFTDDEEAIKFIELRGGADVVPLGAAADTAEMHADSITLAFHPDGSSLQHATLTGQGQLTLTDAAGRRAIQGSWIDFYMAPDGKTLTRLDARDRVVVDLPATNTTPARLIRSTTLTATGRDGKGLERAQFDGGVIFEEREAGARATDPAGRTGRSQSLVLQLDGALESVTVAEFRRTVEFLDGTAEARAERAQYDVRTGLLHLTPGEDPAKVPWVRDDGIELSGRDVKLSTSAGEARSRHDLTARGAVTTRLFPKPGDKKARTALFDADRDINGLAEEVVYTSATRRVTYVGTPVALAQVFQDANRIIGVRIVLDESTGNLEAVDQVDSSLQTPSATAPIAGAGKDKVQEGERTYRITGDRLRYDDKTRRAVYTGKPVVLRDGKREIEATSITLGLGADGRTVDTLSASGDMVARLDKDYELAGDTLEYLAATGKYVVTGAPAIAKTRVDGKQTCMAAMATRLDADTSGGVERTGTVRTQIEVSCDTPIRSIRTP